MTENELQSSDFIFAGLAPVFDHPVPVLCRPSSLNWMRAVERWSGGGGGLVSWSRWWRTGRRR